MAKKLAQKRAGKAQRRNKARKERHKQEATKGRASLAGRVRRLASDPLHRCLLQQGLFENGSGMLFLARRSPTGGLALSGFLLDTYCLGVKLALFQECDDTELDVIVESMSEQAPFVPVEPAYARKLLHEAVAYARGLGFEPPGDYAAAELLFGDVSTEACGVVFEFGLNGRPLYIPGPSETRAQVRRRLEHLRRRLGEEGFDYAEASDGYADDLDEGDFLEDELDLDDVDFGGYDLPETTFVYDPAVAPDSAAWLALEEDERVSAVLAYCRRADLAVPDLRTHAALVATVENQAVLDDPLPVRRAIARLQGEGLDRRQALLAVAWVLIEQIYDALERGEPSAEGLPSSYEAAVEALTAEQWLALAEGEDDDEQL